MRYLMKDGDISICEAIAAGVCTSCRHRHHEPHSYKEGPCSITCHPSAYKTPIYVCKLYIPSIVEADRILNG